MPFIETSAGKMFYAEKRDSLSPYLPLVLIHGAGASHLVWPAEVRRLPDTRVIALDLVRAWTFSVAIKTEYNGLC